MTLTALELCAGAGGQALGLARAGFKHVALIDKDVHACQTLQRNFLNKRIIHADIRELPDPTQFRGIELLAAGLPCPSLAGQLDAVNDDRNLVAAFFDTVHAVKPLAVLVETMPRLMTPKFEAYRQLILAQFDRLGYSVGMQLLDGSDFCVHQKRCKRAVIVALSPGYTDAFSWPDPIVIRRRTVGEILGDLMATDGWQGAAQWAKCANDVAPTIVGGSNKHGGGDLGRARSRAEWAKLGIEGKSLADRAPTADFIGLPRLTFIPMPLVPAQS